MINQLLCIGSVAFDSIETPFGKVNKTLGGSATYFSLASSIFYPTSVIAVVGDDFNPPSASRRSGFDVFKKHKIDISGVKKHKGKTFHWSGKYHFDMNTRDTLKTELGVFANFKPKLNESHKNAKFIFLGNIQPKLQLEVLNQITKPKLIGLDTMNFWIETARKDLLEVIKQIDLLIINDAEARQLTNEHNLLKSAKKILPLMHNNYTFVRPHKSVIRKNPILIIKQGEHGLMLFQGKNIFNLPGFPLEDVVDPTGAGDSFAGALMGYLAKTNDLSWENLKKACLIGSMVASFNVEGMGIKNLTNLNHKKINNRLQIFKKQFS